MYCIIVKTELKSGQRDAFLPLMLDNAAASVREEPGCHVFDVIEDRDQPDTFYLYEIYDDSDALEAHKLTPHYKNTRAQINPMIERQSVIKADVVGRNPVR